MQNIASKQPQETALFYVQIKHSKYGHLLCSEVSMVSLLIWKYRHWELFDFSFFVPLSISLWFPPFPWPLLTWRQVFIMMKVHAGVASYADAILRDIEELNRESVELIRRWHGSYRAWHPSQPLLQDVSFHEFITCLYTLSDRFAWKAELKQLTSVCFSLHCCLSHFFKFLASMKFMIQSFNAQSYRILNSNSMVIRIVSFVPFVLVFFFFVKVFVYAPMSPRIYNIFFL